MMEMASISSTKPKTLSKTLEEEDEQEEGASLYLHVPLSCPRVEKHPYQRLSPSFLDSPHPST